MPLINEIPRLIRYAGRLIRQPNEVEVAGVKLSIPEETKGPVLSSIYAEKYEGLEIAALPRYLRADDVVVEAGAAIGFVGLHCAKHIGLDRLVMIEANPALIPEIEKNFALNGHARPRLLHALAAADEEGTETFRVAEQFWSSSVLDRGQTLQTVEIAKADLNRLFREESASVFICDIEGGEFDLLPKLDFSGVRLILIELHQKLASAQAVAEAVKQIEAQGLALKETLKGEVYIFER
ncbi:MAG: FkbM family methyltransferase [Pseudomonadota bacterium]